MRSRNDCLLQVDFIVQMEDSKKLRRCGKLTRFVCSEDKNKNCILAKLDKMRGLDYKTQEKLVEELMENALDSEGGQKVYSCPCIMYCTLYYRYILSTCDKKYIYSCRCTCTKGQVTIIPISLPLVVVFQCFFNCSCNNNSCAAHVNQQYKPYIIHVYRACVVDLLGLRIIMCGI